MNYNNISVSQHAKERYIERASKLGNFPNSLDIDRDHEYIVNQIISMVDRGTELYYGPTDKNDLISVIRDNLWLLLIDGNTSKVITLYYVDLGLGDEFSMQYLDQMQEKLISAIGDNEKKKQLFSTLNNINSDLEQAVQKNYAYEKRLNSLKAEIAEYEKSISLVAKDIIDLRSNKDKCEKEIESITNDSRSIINTLLQRQVF